MIARNSNHEPRYDPVPEWPNLKHCRAREQGKDHSAGHHASCNTVHVRPVLGGCVRRLVEGGIRRVLGGVLVLRGSARYWAARPGRGLRVDLAP